MLVADQLPTGTRHARLRLHDSTLGTLMRWQSEAVAAGRPKPTYSELIDCLVAGLADHDAGAVLALAIGGDA
ncbi:MAG: hypothetical protein JF886_08485 [Candidatus Dormibacteraeota bacterium]|uniref:Uncharacterized protein n=1 Tax=Candidatus Aeolococcus gillhamiae TaxID=3127015 RepID=A0A934K301_9BACT|nr:hypothetical protein [Candidatus Dormibacteraeota bacterium]